MPALKSLDGRTTTRTSGARRWKVSAESSAITSSTVRIPPVNAMVSPPKQRQSAFWLFKKWKNGKQIYLKYQKISTLNGTSLLGTINMHGIKFKQEKQISPSNRMRYTSTRTCATCLRGQPLFYSTAVFHIMNCCPETSSSSVSHVGAIGQPLFIAASTHPEHHSSVVSIIHLGLNTVWAPHTHHTCISPDHLNKCGGSQNWVNHQCQLFREYNIIKDEISTSNLGNIYDYHVCLYVCLCVCWIILYVSQPLIAILTVHQYATAIF